MALFIEGSDDRINISQTGIDTINGQSAISFSLWVYVIAWGGFDGSDLISFSINNGGTPTGTSRLSMFSPNGLNGEIRLRSRYNDSTTNDCDSSGVIMSTGQWYHLVGVCDIANDFMALYVDGQLDNSETPSFPVSSFPSNDCACAAIGCTADVSANFLHGYFADVRVYQKALSAVEVEHLYHMRGGDNIIDSLYHRWRLLDSFSGDNAVGDTPLDIGSARWTGAVIGAGTTAQWEPDFLHGI